jgi:hypothetical protein
MPVYDEFQRTQLYSWRTVLGPPLCRGGRCDRIASLFSSPRCSHILRSQCRPALRREKISTLIAYLTDVTYCNHGDVIIVGWQVWFEHKSR